MTQFNNNNYPQSQYGQPSSAQPQQCAVGELMEGQSLSAGDLGDYDKGYTLLEPGDYEFTVVALETKRYQPGPNSKIGPCKQIDLTLRVVDPIDGGNVDLKHTLFMFNNQGCISMIAQFYDAVGLHKKGEPITLDWRQEVIIGKSGLLAISHRTNKNDPTIKYNNIKKLYSFGTQPKPATIPATYGQPQQALYTAPTIGNPAPNQWSNGKF